MSNGFTYFIAVLRREATRIFQDKVMLFVCFIAPVFGILMLWWTFSAGVVRHLPMAIVDQDNTATSIKLAHMIGASPTVDITDESPDIKSAQNLMNKGKISAIVAIPKDFEKDIIKGNSPAVVLYINNINVVSGGMLQSGIQKTLMTFSTGIKMQVEMKKGYTQQQALARAMPIRFDNHILFNPYRNYSYFLLMGLLPLSVVVVCFLGTLYAFGMEIKEGSAKQLMRTANNNIFIAIAGKILPHTFIYVCAMRVVSLIMIHAIGLPMHGNIWLLLISETLMILAYQSVALVFIALTSNLRLSLSLGSAYTMMAMTFSGLTFPTLGMPFVAQLLSKIFPFTYWLKIFMNETLRSIPNLHVTQSFIGLFVFILLAIICFAKLERVFTNDKYWGKS